MKANDINKFIVEDGEARSDTSNFALNKPLLTAKNKKVIGVMKEELGGKIMKEFIRL